MEPVLEQETDTLGSLEQRITRAVELITTLRGENEKLHQQLASTHEELGTTQKARDEAHGMSLEFQKENAELELRVKRLAQDLDDLRGERKQVKARIEKLLGQMDLISIG